MLDVLVLSPTGAPTSPLIRANHNRTTSNVEITRLSRAKTYFKGRTSTLCQHQGANDDGTRRRTSTRGYRDHG